MGHSIRSAMAGTVAALAFATPRSAQITASVRYSVAGTVAIADGTPVAGVEIALVDHDTITVREVTHTDGHFQFDSLPSAHAVLRVRGVGFAPRTVAVDVPAGLRATTLYITLDPIAEAPADADTVDEATRAKLDEFFTRAGSNHFGHYVTPKQLDQLRPQLASDALRAVPGVVLRPAPNGIGNEVRIRGCAPLVWIDGVRSPGAQVDDLARGADIAAIEVYSSTAGVPGEFFDRSATCGTLLVWLKVR